MHLLRGDFLLAVGLAVAVPALSGAASGGRRGIDASMSAVATAKLWESAPAELKVVPGTWLRLRENGLQFLGKTDGRWGSVDLAKETETKTALRLLRARGFRIMALIELTHHDWPGGVHVASGTRMAADLNDVAGYARALPAAYAGLVDAWEVENEPDLGFVSSLPESYAAYLKAFYLGLKDGCKERGAANNALNPGFRSQVSGFRQSPIVLMGALGLPPGPWMERFAANDGFAYTDGFSFHYYGYAADFTGVYRQHEAAVKELTRGSGSRSQVPPRKSFPVYLTEAGYGLLGIAASSSPEGRLRQWRWFESIGRAAAELKLAAATAFVLKPYPAYAATELGMTEKAEARSKVQGERVFSAGGNRYTPEDFGSRKVAPWMKNIGVNIGGYEASPALAWWLTPSERVSGKVAVWRWSVPEVSPVVIDFLADEGLQPVKRYNGSFVVGLPPEGKPAPPAKGPGSFQQPPGEEFMLHVRTANGNLYEVYPTRKATPAWQSYLEPRDNFTASFYGRASLPWRFTENQPAALVAVMYPRELPVTYEFRRPRLVRFEPRAAAGGKQGRGRIVLYNISGAPIAGRLLLPPAAVGAPAELAVTIAPGERREVPVQIQLPGAVAEPGTAEFRFAPETTTAPQARFITKFLPDPAGQLPATVAELLPVADNATHNRRLAAGRQRVLEELPMTASGRFFIQPGATVMRTEDGFAVTITAMPPGTDQRIEVEMPWPDELAFNSGEYLAMDYRLRLQR